MPSFAILLLFSTAPAQAPVQPTPLPVNTAADEDEPHVSGDDLTLYYASTDKAGKVDILMVRRRKDQPWKTTGTLPGDAIRSTVDDRSTFEGAARFPKVPQYLYFATRKDKDTDNFDLYFSRRLEAHGPLAAPQALTLVNTAADELHPWLSPDGRTLHFSRKDKDGWRVYVATRPDGNVGGGFAAAAPVKELPADFHHATLTRDGKTMYLQGPVGDGKWGLFRSVRGASGWGKPEPLKSLNAAEGTKGDVSPNLSRDGVYLYFASDRPGGKGGLDLYRVPTAQLTR